MEAVGDEHALVRTEAIAALRRLGREGQEAIAARLSVLSKGQSEAMAEAVGEFDSFGPNATHLTALAPLLRAASDSTEGQSGALLAIASWWKPDSTILPTFGYAGPDSCVDLSIASLIAALLPWLDSPDSTAVEVAASVIAVLGRSAVATLADNPIVDPLEVSSATLARGLSRGTPAERRFVLRLLSKSSPHSVQVSNQILALWATLPRRPTRLRPTSIVRIDGHPRIPNDQDAAIDLLVGLGPMARSEIIAIDASRFGSAEEHVRALVSADATEDALRVVTSILDSYSSAGPLRYQVTSDLVGVLNAASKSPHILRSIAPRIGFLMDCEQQDTASGRALLMDDPVSCLTEIDGAGAPAWSPLVFAREPALALSCVALMPACSADTALRLRASRVMRRALLTAGAPAWKRTASVYLASLGDAAAGAIDPECIQTALRSAEVPSDSRTRYLLLRAMAVRGDTLAESTPELLRIARVQPTATSPTASEIGASPMGGFRYLARALELRREGTLGPVRTAARWAALDALGQAPITGEIRLLLESLSANEDPHIASRAARALRRLSRAK